MQPAAFAARLTSTLALVAACQRTDGGTPDTDADTEVAVGTDTDTAVDTGLKDADFLAMCAATPARWTPLAPWQHLRLAQDCIAVPTGDPCPDPHQPVPWTRTGTPYNSCATETTLCVVALTERRDEVMDSDVGFDTADRYDACCYTYVGPAPDYVCGRAHWVGDRPTTAPTTGREGWRRPVGVTAPTDPIARRAAADRWLADARTEHASIAAFARLALDLLAHAAPAALIARVNDAMADEVRHAEDAFAIASALAGCPLGPGPLPMDAAPTPTLVELAVATARDGGIGEALAAGIAAARLSVATDPTVRAVLAGVVADEARHAVLAWEIVAWAIEVGGGEVREAVDEVIERLATQDAVVAREPVVPEVGLCGDGVVRRAVRRVWAEVLTA